MATRVLCINCNNKVKNKYKKLASPKNIKLSEVFGLVGHVCSGCIENKPATLSNSQKAIAGKLVEKTSEVDRLRELLREAAYRKFPKTPIGSGHNETRSLAACACVQCKELNHSTKEWISHAFFRLGKITSQKNYLCPSCNNGINEAAPSEGCYNLFVINKLTNNGVN